MGSEMCIRDSSITRPDYVSISGVNVVAGMLVTDADFNVTEEQKINPAKMRVKNIPGNDLVKVRWIVKGNAKFTITVDSEKGGVVTKRSN